MVKQRVILSEKGETPPVRIGIESNGGDGVGAVWEPLHRLYDSGGVFVSFFNQKLYELFVNECAISSSVSIGCCPVRRNIYSCLLSNQTKLLVLHHFSASNT